MNPLFGGGVLLTVTFLRGSVDPKVGEDKQIDGIFQHVVWWYCIRSTVHSKCLRKDIAMFVLTISCAFFRQVAVVCCDMCRYVAVCRGIRL